MFKKTRERLARWLDGSRALAPSTEHAPLRFVLETSLAGCTLTGRCQGYEMFGTVEPCGQSPSHVYALCAEDELRIGEPCNILLCDRCRHLILGDATGFDVEAAIEDDVDDEDKKAGDGGRQLMQGTGSRERFNR